ncbi:MAG: protein kinase [Planctomycetaceae bacterium]|nr:protein kinase [Planctomycetaceae bacterium]
MPYLVMPFARGPSLQKRLDESGPLATVEVVRIGRQIAAGLAAAHEQGLVHRDIKPANILLNEGIERLWITDFGVARAVDDASMTQTGVIAGTPQYMSPEQARGESVSPSSDLFSMGSVLYTACTGRAPFRAEAAWGILRRITDTQPRSIRELNPEIPQWLCRIIERLMAKDPVDRFSDAAEVAQILEQCLAHLQQPEVVALPSDPAHGAMAEPAYRGGTATAESQPLLQRVFQKLGSLRLGRTALGSIATIALALVVWQATSPPDIQGNWGGEAWPAVELSTVENAAGWYSGAFVDQQGRKGALQLEWSRLQRRFTGRWKVGDAATGSLTLRMREGRISGAVAVDADSAVSDETPRLRDFIWQRGAGPADLSVATPERRVGRRQALQSPIAGAIRWSEGIVENSRVEKGQLIAQIVDVDPNMMQRLEAQTQVQETNLVAMQSALEATEARVRAVTNRLDFSKSRLVALEDSQNQSEQASQDLLDAHLQKVEVEKKKLDSINAVLKQRETELARQQKLFESAVVSELKVQLAERQLAEQQAQVDGAVSAIKSAEIKVAAVKSESLARRQQFEADIADAKAKVFDDAASLAEAESTVSSSQANLAKARKELEETKIKLARQQSYSIVAPMDGVLTQLSGLQILKTGDVVCYISTQQSAPVSRGNIAPQPVQESSSVTQVASDVFRPQDIAGIPGQPASALAVSSAIETALSLGRRMRQLFPKGLDGANPQTQTSAQVENSRDRATAISILETQLNAARERYGWQKTMRQQAEQQRRLGQSPVTDLMERELGVADASATLQQLQLLLNYYNRIGTAESDPKSDAEFARKVLQTYLDSVKERIALHRQLHDIARQRFEMGDADATQVSETEQAAAAAEADLRTTQALLRHYSSDGQEEEAPSPPADDSQGK